MGNKLEVSVGINNAGWKQGLDSMRDGAKKFKGELSNMFVGVAGPVAIAAGAVMTLKRAFDKASEMEGFEVAFKTLLGSMSAAKQRMKELSDFAASTPFDLPEVAKASKTLQTLTDGALATGDGLRLIGDAAATAQVPFGELAVTAGRVYAGAMAGSNTIGAEINRLVELGLVSVTTKNRVADLLKEGKKGSEVWGVVARDLERFKGQMEAMSDTLGGKLSTLGDAWDELLRRFAQPLMPNVKDGASEITSTMEDLAQLAGWLGAVIATAVDAAILPWKALGAEIYGVVEMVKALKNGDLAGAGQAIMDGHAAASQAGKEAWNRAEERFSTEPDKAGDKSSGKVDAEAKAEANKAALEEEKAVQKREDRLQKIRDAEAEAARDALEGQEKINALIEERNRLLEDYKNNTDEDKGIDSLEKAQKVQRDIESETKRQAEQRKKQEDDIAQKRADEAEAEVEREARIAAARKDEFQTREDDVISTLSGEDKIKALQTKLQRMEEEAKTLEESDPEAASRLRGQMVGVNAQIRGERQALKDGESKKVEDQAGEVDKAKDALDQARRAAASVPVDSLQAVGGGRGNIGGGDAGVRAAEKTANAAQQILATLQAQFGKNEPVRDTFYDR